MQSPPTEKGEAPLLILSGQPLTSLKPLGRVCSNHQIAGGFALKGLKESVIMRSLVHCPHLSSFSLLAEKYLNTTAVISLSYSTFSLLSPSFQVCSLDFCPLQVYACLGDKRRAVARPHILIHDADSLYVICAVYEQHNPHGKISLRISLRDSLQKVSIESLQISKFSSIFTVQK